jgi:hypothetical protein
MFDHTNNDVLNLKTQNVTIMPRERNVDIHALET